MRSETFPRQTEEERRRGHLYSTARLQKKRAVGRWAGPRSAEHEAQTLRRDPSRASAGTHSAGKGLKRDPDPQGSARTEQRCQRLPALPKCTSLCSTWPGLLALKGDVPRYRTFKGAKSELERRTRPTARLSRDSGGAMPCRGYPELRGMEPRKSWGRETSCRGDLHPS